MTDMEQNGYKMHNFYAWEIKLHAAAMSETPTEHNAEYALYPQDEPHAALFLATQAALKTVHQEVYQAAL